MLIPNAAAVARRSYSMWAFYVLGALQLAELVPDLLAPYGWFGLSPTVVGVLSLLAAFAGGVGRLIAQRSPGGRGDFWRDETGAVRLPRGRVTASAAGLALVVAFVGGWEGLRLSPYKDGGGVPTVCYGETEVAMRNYTAAECEAMFARRLVYFETGLDRLLVEGVEIPSQSKAAFVSWAYNVGLGAARQSTLVRKLNAGDLAGACRELVRWNKDNGRTVAGLVNRRADELRLCLAGVAGRDDPAAVEAVSSPVALPRPEHPDPARVAPSAALHYRGQARAVALDLSACRENIATRKGIEDALDRLPRRPDLILDRLRELAAGAL